MSCKQNGIVRLMWQATKFITRTIVQIVRRGVGWGIRCVQPSAPSHAKSATIKGDYTVPPIHTWLRAWRVWSADRAHDKTHQTERFHWGTKK